MANKKSRGLAKANPETRRRVAQMGGMSHDRAFFSEIGRLGGRKRGKRNKQD